MEQGTNTSSERNGGNGIVGRIRDTATAQLNTQKDKATEGLGTVASAVRESTQNLRNQQHDVAARYVEQAADHIERVAARLREKDATELLKDVQQLARRRPALFVGAAFAVGLLGARFLKSSAPDGAHDMAYNYRDPMTGPLESRANTSTVHTPPYSMPGAATEGY